MQSVGLVASQPGGGSTVVSGVSVVVTPPMQASADKSASCAEMYHLQLSENRSHLQVARDLTRGVP